MRLFTFLRWRERNTNFDEIRCTRGETHKQRETTEQSHANVLQPQPEQCISHVRTISRSFHLQYSQKPCFKMSILIHLFDAFDDFFACGMRGHEKRFFGEIAQLDNLPTLERVNEHMTLPTQGLTWPVNTRLDARNTTLLGRKANNKRLRHRRHFDINFANFFVVLTLPHHGRPLAGNASVRLTKVRCIATRTQARWWQRQQDDTHWYCIMKILSLVNGNWIRKMWHLTSSMP